MPSDIYRLYEGLPRQGPGSDDLTCEALRRLGPLPASPRVLDLGCGTGRQTLVLARELRARVVAVDNHAPFLRDLERRAAAASLSQLVETRAGDMGALDVEPGTVDLIWSEGAIYNIGFESGLRTWRAWLAPGGKIAVTECSWLTDHPPAEIKAFWDAEYPGMSTIAGNREKATRAGFAVVDTFALPPSAWWDDYYRPLLARLDELGPEAKSNAVLSDAIAASRHEIELFARFSETYGYVFYLLQAA